MPTATVFLSADTKAPEGMSRMANARTAIKEFGHAVIIFDAAATRWVPRLTDAG